MGKSLLCFNKYKQRPPLSGGHVDYKIRCDSASKISANLHSFIRLIGDYRIYAHAHELAHGVDTIDSPWMDGYAACFTSLDKAGRLQHDSIVGVDSICS